MSRHVLVMLSFKNQPILLDFLLFYHFLHRFNICCWIDILCGYNLERQKTFYKRNTMAYVCNFVFHFLLFIFKVFLL